MANSRPLFLPASTDAATAWLFPGQGSQAVGMGRDLWDGSAAARAVFEIADRVLGYALSEICFDGPEERLRQTEYTQPAIMATSLACLAAALESGSVDKRPAVLAGHSIGEYAALVIGGSVSTEDGLRLVQERARLMAECGRMERGTMAAILGMDETAVRAICAETDADICNLNQANQVVIGGRPDAVARAVALAKERGARVIELNVSGAFHSRLMRPAIAGMEKALGAVEVAVPEVPVIGNLSVVPLASPSAVREELAAQVANPVRWHESMSLMASMGISTYIEFGPGRVLTGMAKRSFPDAKLVNVSGLLDAVGEPGVGARQA